MANKQHEYHFTTIIVTYNSEHEIAGLLKDLEVHRNPQPVIVVDNNSRDHTVDLIRQEFPHVRLVENKVDTGYGRAVNQAFRLCDTEFIFLLNPDMRLPDRTVSDTLSSTIKRHPEVAAVAPLQFKETAQKQRLNFTWSYWNPRALGLFFSSLLRLEIPDAEPIPVTYLNAGCLFIRSSAFRKVGMFNEKYFLYGEEPDLFLKFKRYGYTSLLLPDVQVIHLRESSIKSLASSEYLKVKLQGSANILDAFMTGWLNILRDAFTMK